MDATSIDNVEQENAPEIRYQELSGKINNWVSQNTDKGTRENFRNSIDFGMWKGSSGETYWVSARKDEKETYVLIRRESKSGEHFSPFENFIYNNGEDKNAQRLVYERKKIHPPWRDYIDTLEYGAYNFEQSEQAKDPEAKPVNVFDKFEPVITDLMSATQISK